MTPDEGVVHHKPNLNVSYVPQNLRSIDITTNGQSLSSIDVSNVQKNIAAALDATETSHLINAQMNALSGGEFQRVASASYFNYRIAVLDEPVQGLITTVKLHFIS